MNELREKLVDLIIVGKFVSNDDDYDEHFHSLSKKILQNFAKYNRLYTPLTHFNKCINILKIDISNGKINCYWYSHNLYSAYTADLMYVHIVLVPIF